MGDTRASTTNERFSFDMQKRSTAAVRLTMLQEGFSRRVTARPSTHQPRPTLKGECMQLKPSYFSFNRYAKTERFYVRRPFNDFDDISRDPSFTKFMADYVRKCDLRYRAACTKYERQFQKEIKNLLTYQASASEAVNFMKHVNINTYWPPLHTRKELKRTSTFFEMQKPAARKRLQFLLNNKID